MTLKAVAVLAGSEGVGGTVYFTQDGGGKDLLLSQGRSLGSGLESMGSMFMRSAIQQMAACQQVDISIQKAWNTGLLRMRFGMLVILAIWWLERMVPWTSPLQIHRFPSQVRIPS